MSYTYRDPNADLSRYMPHRQYEKTPMTNTPSVEEHVVPPWMEKGWYDPHNDMIVWESTRRPFDLEDGEEEYPVVYRIPADWADD